MPRRAPDWVDPDARPADYWNPADPVAAITGNITGQLRREMVRDIVSGLAPEGIGPLHESFLADVLPPAQRWHLGARHPAWMGGEYLPPYLPGEVEIARIVLRSSTQDVIAVRARRRGGRILYRVVDEYGDELGGLVWRPKSSRRPLTFAQLVALIDGLAYAGEDDVRGTFPDRLRARGCDHLELGAAFVRVESPFYRDLEAWYVRDGARWAAARRRGVPVGAEHAEPWDELADAHGDEPTEAGGDDGLA